MTSNIDYSRLSIATAFTRLLDDWLNSEALSAPALRYRVAQPGRHERIGLADWAALLNEAQRLKPAQPVGLHIGACVRIRHTGVLGYLILNSDSLGEALETYLDCEHQFYGINFAQLGKTATSWHVYWPVGDLQDIAIIVEVAFAALYSFMRQRFGAACRLQAVSLCGTAPTNTQVYQDFFGCPVSFDSSNPGLRFAIDDVQQPAPLTDEGEFGLLRREQEQAFSELLDTRDGFLTRLQQVMLRLLPGGQTSLTQAAAEMHVSPRTLQRRLRGYGVGYQPLLDGLREQLAMRYLRHSALTLAQLAQLLGYSEQSALNRAFKQWTGHTPGQYRDSRT